MGGHKTDERQAIFDRWPREHGDFPRISRLKEAKLALDDTKRMFNDGANFQQHPVGHLEKPRIQKSKPTEISNIQNRFCWNQGFFRGALLWIIVEGSTNIYAWLHGSFQYLIVPKDILNLQVAWSTQLRCRIQVIDAVEVAIPVA